MLYAFHITFASRRLTIYLFQEDSISAMKTAYEVEGISRTYEDQAAMLVAEKKDGNFKGVFSQVLQDVLRRLDKSFKAFFRRVKNSEKPGYPRFKGKGWYKSS